MASENPGAARVVSLSDGTSHLIGSLPLTVGRDPVSDILLDEEDVSRRHAYLLRTPQGFLLVDSSLHGTWVNGERIQAQRLLADRDVIQMGSRSFRFEVYRPAAASARGVERARRASDDERVFPDRPRRPANGQDGPRAGARSGRAVEDRVS